MPGEFDFDFGIVQSAMPLTVLPRTLRDYIRTLIHVREAYGYDEDRLEDWWHPYATHGARYNLDQ